LNPNSKGDRAKLVRTEELLEARQQRSEWEAVIEGRSQPVATPLLVRESLQRIGALVGAALCGIFLIMATLVSVYDRSPLHEGDAGSPIPLLHSARPLTVTETPQEQFLRQRVNEVSGGSGQAVHVELDPRKRSANLRVLLPAASGKRLSPFDYKVKIMREAYRHAQALLRQDDTLTVIEVRVVGELPSGLGGTTLLFLGMVARENLVVAPDRLSPQELQQFFGAVAAPYWPPELANL
jgi:hypothetical protein